MKAESGMGHSNDDCDGDEQSDDADPIWTSGCVLPEVHSAF